MTPSVHDIWHRPLRDLRVSVTDRCNFRCPYCMPAAVFGADYPYLPETAKMTEVELRVLLQAFRALGVQKLRFTGGEPLVRKDMVALVRLAKQELGFAEVALTTNGWFLAEKAAALREAGLDRLNVSLDSLVAQTAGAMNGRGFGPERVLAGIAAARLAGLPLKVNTVIQRGVNDTEIEALAGWARDQGLPLRFIEFMDVGNHNHWQGAQVVSAREIVRRIGERWPLAPLEPAYRGEVAARYAYADGRGEIGLISSITEPFCSQCNRARLSADGRLHTCLFSAQGHDLLSMVRRGDGTEGVRAAVEAIWQRRTDRYSDERAERLARGETTPKAEMSYLGG